MACHRTPAGPALERSDDEPLAVPDLPVPPEDGPKLGAVATLIPVVDRPSTRGAVLGALHAGATVARAAEPFSRRGCDGGWYPIRPRGFACAGSLATVDLRHPTLAAMAIQPDRDGTLPYTYARAIRDTKLFEVDPGRDAGVRPLSPFRAKTGLAVVGSWNALDPEGKRRDLAMTTEGRFVPTADLEAITPSAFVGVELGEARRLPIAFVVKRGVRAWDVAGDRVEKRDPLPYHAELDLTGRNRRVGGVEFWATADGRWIRLEDVTLVRERHELPAFATGEQRWLDVSVVTGSLVAYEGKKAVFATLVSVGRDRLGGPEANAVTERGELRVTAKQITALGRDPAKFTDGPPLHDVPWVLELSSGQLLVGAYWHDRFGIERSPGNVELSPGDAARIFRWAAPEVPRGWHAVSGEKDRRTVVVVRK